MNMNDMSIAEKVSYIKGLAEGLGVNDDTDEGKVIGAIIEVLGDIAASIEEIDDDLDDLSDDVFDIGESVGGLEDAVYGEDDYDDDEDFDERGHRPPRRGRPDDDDMYETVCPECGAEVILDFNTASKGVMSCPNCGTEFELEFGDALGDFDEDNGEDM